MVKLKKTGTYTQEQVIEMTEQTMEYKHVVIILNKGDYKEDITIKEVKDSTEYDDTANKIIEKMYPDAVFSHKNIQTTGTIDYDNGTQIVLNEETGSFALIYVYETYPGDEAK